jgi:hypothetical protein
MNERTYVEAYVAAHVRLHRPQWSWARMRRVCSCGDDLPCRRLMFLPKTHYWTA